MFSLGIGAVLVISMASFTGIKHSLPPSICRKQDPLFLLGKLVDELGDVGIDERPVHQVVVKVGFFVHVWQSVCKRSGFGSEGVGHDPFFSIDQCPYRLPEKSPGQFKADRSIGLQTVKNGKA